jgi:hypothetical protein
MGPTAAPVLPASDAVVPSVSPPDPYVDDPFFKSRSDSTWNACIGKQGDEEHYLDGYMEAAIELADAVIEKKMYEKRDTLVLPILYNVRHAVELALKFATDRLAAAGLVQPPSSPNHDIKAYWERLEGASLGDEKLLEILRKLKPFIDSLSRIDSDGQELRYHVNRDGTPSLEGYSLANLEVIRTSLSELSDILSVLKCRTLSFISERETGTFTNRCSRRDLLTIAQVVPRRDSWNSPLFDERKASIKTRFNLCNREFADALNAIQGNREMKVILGMETDLVHVLDDDVVWIAEQWRRLHPRRDGDSNGPAIKSGNLVTLDAMLEQMDTEREVIDEIEKRICADQLAEVEAMFYLARDRIFPEYYEQRIEKAQKEHAAAGDPGERIDHLISKTNFCTACKKRPGNSVVCHSQIDCRRYDMTPLGGQVRGGSDR